MDMMNMSKSSSRTPPTLSLSSTSVTQPDHTSQPLNSQKKERISTSETLNKIGKKHKNKFNIRPQPNLEQLLDHADNTQASASDPPSVINIMHRGGGSNPNLLKRINSQQSDKPKELPASFKKFQNIKDNNNDNGGVNSPISPTSISSMNNSITPKPQDLPSSFQSFSKSKSPSKSHGSNIQGKPKHKSSLFNADFQIASPSQSHVSDTDPDDDDDQQSHQPFIPPSPAASVSKKNNKQLFNDNDNDDNSSSDDDQNMQYLSYGTNKSHVIDASMDSNEDKPRLNYTDLTVNTTDLDHGNLKQKKKTHYRGRSNSVDTPLTQKQIQKFTAYNADNVHLSDDTSSDNDDDDAFHRRKLNISDLKTRSNIIQQQTIKKNDNNQSNNSNISSLKIQSSLGSNPIRQSLTPSINGVPQPYKFKLVAEDEEDDDDDFDINIGLQNNINNQQKTRKSHKDQDKDAARQSHKKSNKKPKMYKSLTTDHINQKMNSYNNYNKASAFRAFSQSHTNGIILQDVDTNNTSNTGSSYDDFDDNSSTISGSTITSVGGTKRKKKWYKFGLFGSKKKNLTKLNNNNSTTPLELSTSISESNNDTYSDTASIISSKKSGFTPRWTKKKNKNNKMDFDNDGFPNTDYVSDNMSVIGGSDMDDNKNNNKRVPIFDHNDMSLTNREVTEKILGFKHHEWHFENDMVNVYRAQCATLKHERFLKSLINCIFPTITSSLALPINYQSKTYTVNVKYNVFKFKKAALTKQNEQQEEKADHLTPLGGSVNNIHNPNQNQNIDDDIDDDADNIDMDNMDIKIDDNMYITRNDDNNTENNQLNSLLYYHDYYDINADNISGNNNDKYVMTEHDIEMVELEFNHETSTQDAIKSLWGKISKSKNGQNRLEFNLLDIDCFILKTCGREEYLTFNDNLRIVQSNFVRHCLRNNEISDNLEFVLLYIHDLNSYNEKKYLHSLNEWHRHNTYQSDIFEYYANKPLISDIVDKKSNNSNSSRSMIIHDNDNDNNLDNNMDNHPKNNNSGSQLLGVIEEDKEDQIIAAKKKAKTKEKQLKYENLGYNCIVNTLINSNQQNKLTLLNKEVEGEVDWLYSTIGSVLKSDNNSNPSLSSISSPKHNRGQSRSFMAKKHRSIGSIHRLPATALNSLHYASNSHNNNNDDQQIDIDWENISQSAVLLDEFEHPIEIKIKSLKNICNSPRFNKNYTMIVLRVELMFGCNTFEECSWDIRIPLPCVSNNLKLPLHSNTFSTEIAELYYSMLPREATWCFTVYGIKENTDYDQNNKSNNNSKYSKNNKNNNLKHINNHNYTKKNNNKFDDLVSVGGGFSLFNKSSSRSRITPRSPRSPSPTSPNTVFTNKNAYGNIYTPRGAKLKTTRAASSKLNIHSTSTSPPSSNKKNKNINNIDNSSDGSSASGASYQSSNLLNNIEMSQISVSLVTNDDNSDSDLMIIDDFSDLFYGPGGDDDDDDNNNNNKNSKNNNKSDLLKLKWHSEPLAWCRLPVVNHRHCIRSGSFQLHLWRVPQYKYKKGGPKVDPYSTGFWKKFGTTRDRNLKVYETLKNNKKKNSKKNKYNKMNKKFGVDDIDDINNKLDIILNIEFPHFNFDIVAPLVNPRRPEYLARQIRPYKRKLFPGKQVLDRIIEQDGITPLDDKDKMLVYSNKEKLMRYPEAIPTFLRSVDWLDVELRMEAYDYLERWKKPDNPEDMIELLRYEFPDTRIRLYAINCLNQLDDYTLNRYLLQLVQALKNELHHNSFLSRFLIFRALRNPMQIGHYLFWHLKSEYHSMGWCERFGIILEEYLLYLPNNLEIIGCNYSKQLLYSNNLMNRLTLISQQIQNFKKHKKYSQTKLDNHLKKELTLINNEFIYDPSITLPLNPALKVKKLKVNKCKFMSSAKAPLWLVFNNFDDYTDLYPENINIAKKLEQDHINQINLHYQQKKGGKKKKNKNKNKKKHYNPIIHHNYPEHDIRVIYKCGDDLRQDILTLQLISVMDAFWLEKNSDLRMKPYQVIQTGFQAGMVELVLPSKTTNQIHDKQGSMLGAFKNKAHLNYLEKHHPKKSKLNKKNKKNKLNIDDDAYDELDKDFKLAQENYARSCAGYSVATWVLGIGDRHPDNIMIHKSGVLFHIDFGHFLGNFKEKHIAGGMVKWKRERTPFVFTTLMKYAIDEGKDNCQLYREFVQWLFKAYSEIRIRFKFFLNLFLLMVPSHMPELIREYDVSYLRNALKLDLTSFQEVALHVEKTINDCLKDKNRLVDAAIHQAKHN